MKRLSLAFFLVEALLFTFCVSFQVSGASISEPSIVQVTYQQQIHQILEALTEAINDTTTYNRCADCILDGSIRNLNGSTYFNLNLDDSITQSLDILLPALPVDERKSAIRSIRHFMDSYQQETSPAACRLTFKPYVTVDLKGGYRSMVEVLVEFGNMAAKKTVEVNFQPGELCPVITNLNEVLDEVEPFLEKSVKEMEPYASKKPVVKSASATTPFLSNNLLLPNYIGYGSYKRFTSSVSHAEYGYDILSGPYGFFCMVYRDQQMPQLDREFLIVADRNDNRITATTKNLNDPDQPHWFQQIGPFYHPMAVAYMGQNWYVSEDTVVHVYWSDWNGNWSHTDYLVGGFKNIVDMDAARIPTGENDIWEVAVLDRSNKTIKIFNYDGVLQRTLSTYCSDPTALCYARNGITGYKNHYLYVLDNDGNRIVKIDSWGIAVPIISDPGLFPSDAQLTSAATDAYATLYVLDRNNSVCHVFGGTSEPIATFGTGPGTADNQLYYPRRLRIAEGWKYYTGPDSVGPLHLGDGFVTELYTSNTGLRRFVLGCDVVEDTMIYFPQYQPGYGDRVGVYWRISNTAETWREVWADGIQLDYQHDPINVPGSHYHVYWLDESDPDSTWYKFIIRVKSIYGTTDTTFVDSIYVVRYMDPGPRFVFDYPDLLDPSGEFPRWCFHKDTSRWWGLSISGEDRHQDSTLLLYTWSNYSGIKLYKDTISCEYAWYLLCQESDTMWFKFKYYPSGHPEGGYAHIFTTLFSTDPYDSTKPEYYNYNWYPDAVETWEHLYSQACETPCTPDCPPINHGCPMLHVWDGGQYRLVNNVLPESEITGADVTDWLPIYDAYHVDSQYYRIRISEDENEISYFEQFELYAFDVPETGEEVVVTNDQEVCVLAGSVTNPISAVTNDGEYVTHLFSEDESVFQANGYGYIDLEYTVPPSDSEMILGTQRRPLPKAYMKPGTEGDQTSNTLYAKNENGEWEVVDRAHPRMQQGIRILVDLSDYVSDSILRLRLEWTTEISISNLPYATYEKVDVIPEKAKLVSAVHSDNGEVSSKLGKAADQVALSPGQSIELTFNAEPPADGMTRVLLFKATGRYETMTDLADGNLLPVDFEFPQNYPNPFNPTTTFSFSLPRAEHVRLEIFNILGQKVATVIDGDYEAGDHKVEWDGSAHASGVYLYRLEAGEFTESKKMLLLK